LLGALGISLAAFRIAGGLLLFVIAHNMVFAKGEEIRTKPQVTAKKRRDPEHRSLPAGDPDHCRPGRDLGNDHPRQQGGESPPAHCLLAVVAVAIGTCLAVMLPANRIERFLGETGRIIVSRLFGMIRRRWRCSSSSTGYRR
jgi:multiple antibiotic resistance protein